jgi:thiosulfate/3-mercaptopyruvate sulfurtransferase
MHPGRQPRTDRRRFIALAAGVALLPQAIRGQGAATPAPGGYAHPDLLVGPSQVAPADQSTRLVAFMPESEVANGVIPGSVRIDWPDLETADTSEQGLAAWVATIDHRLTDLGITPGSSVMVYDPGTLFATRLWWLLHAVGHREAQVLDGGLAAWTGAGFETTGEVAPAEAAAAAYGAKLQPGIIAPIAEVEAAVGSVDVTFVDARAPREWEDGHIPGAINIPYEQNVSPDQPPTWLEQDSLEALYAAVPRETRVIPYCSSGVRSAVTAFTLRLIGYPDVGLFTGSWNEWSADPTRPVTTGNQP